MNSRLIFATSLLTLVSACGGSTVEAPDVTSTDAPKEKATQTDARPAAAGATAWYDAGGNLHACKQTGKLIDFDGIETTGPGSLPSGGCSTAEACAASVSIGPYCGDEASGVTNYTCECLEGEWQCMAESIAGGESTTTYCDGGPGTQDPP